MSGEDNLEQIGELLIEEGIVTCEEISDALQAAGQGATPLGRALLRANPVRRRELAAFLAMDVEIPHVDLLAVDASPDVVSLIPESLARKYAILPLACFGQVLCVARSDMPARSVIAEIRRTTGLKVKVVRADASQVEAAIDQAYGGGAPARSDLDLSLTSTVEPDAGSPGAGTGLRAVLIRPEEACGAADPEDVRRVIETWERVFATGLPIPAEPLV
jgi:hypothetical protein